MITISLHDLEFEGFHGIHEEERLLGNTYIVNCTVQINPVDIIHHINETIDYEVLYNIIKERMQIPTALLETVCMEMGVTIEKKFSDLKSVSIQIHKMHPLIPGFIGNSSVTYHKEF